MLKKFISFSVISIFCIACNQNKAETNINKLKKMFEDVTLNKKADMIPTYYHSDSLLYTNNITMTREKFLETHTQTCLTPIKFDISYDEETLIEENDKVAGRIWITTTMPNKPPHKIEVMLIATYKDDKIYRLWELTYPDWSKLPEFEENK